MTLSLSKLWSAFAKENAAFNVDAQNDGMIYVGSHMHSFFGADNYIV